MEGEGISKNLCVEVCGQTFTDMWKGNFGFGVTLIRCKTSVGGWKFMNNFGTIRTVGYDKIQNRVLELSYSC